MANPQVKMVAGRDAGQIGRPMEHSVTGGGKSTTVADRSETDPIVEEGLNRSLDHAAVLAKRWDAKNKKQAKVKWYNPLAPVKKRPLFGSRAACQKDIDTNYKNSKIVAMKDNQPYTPQKLLVSPKRTLSDLMDPRHLAAHQSALQVAGEMQHIGKLARRESGMRLSAGTLIAMTEGQSIPRVKDLANDELKSLCMKAGVMGKRRLARAGRDEAAKRGLKVLIV